MSLYAESSAVLAWLLDEAAGTFVRQTPDVRRAWLGSPDPESL